MEDMSVLEPTFQEVGYRGENLTITALKVGQIPRFLRAAKPVFGALAGLANGAKELDLVGLVAEHGDALIEAAAVATGKTPDWLGEGGADEFAHLIKAILEVNGDFFAKKVAPQLEGAGMTGVGLTPSNS